VRITPIILAVLGAALALTAFVLYPKRTAELPPPASSTLAVDTTGPIEAIRYRVAQSAPAIARIIVSVVLPSGEPAGAVSLKVAPPDGISFAQCRAPACVTSPALGSASSIWTKQLAFMPTVAGQVANAEFPVKARNFGVTFNGVTAAAAIPEVIYDGPNNLGAVLIAAYRIPSAASYDWSSSFLSADPTRSPTTFHERLPSGDTPARAAIGINHDAQEHDANMTFWAGIVAGLAAGAILSAIQEFLHGVRRPLRSLGRNSGGEDAR
jgi:hypothetical protein